MSSFIKGNDRNQVSLLPACVDDVGEDALVRIVDGLIHSLDLAELGFRRAIASSTGRPGYHPGDMPSVYLGYLNQLRSSKASGTGLPARSRCDVAHATPHTRLSHYCRVPPR